MATLDDPLLDDKVCIVTGAGHGGIGRAHAMELAKHGAKVIVNDVGGSVHGEGSGRDADLTVGIITDRGGEAVANYADVADYDAAGAMVQQAVDTWGRLDVLVNNAGIVRDGAGRDQARGPARRRRLRDPRPGPALLSPGWVLLQRDGA